MNVERLLSVSFFLIFLVCCATARRVPRRVPSCRRRVVKRTVSLNAVSTLFACASYYLVLSRIVPRLYRSDGFVELLKAATETQTNEDTSALRNRKFKNDFRTYGMAVLVSSLRAFNIYCRADALHYLTRATSTKISFLNTRPSPSSGLDATRKV